jgi:hypothetical protein
MNYFFLLLNVLYRYKGLALSMLFCYLKVVSVFGYRCNISSAARLYKHIAEEGKRYAVTISPAATCASEHYSVLRAL